jgi:predicted GNAT superfamily acetyltransferase
VNAARNIHHFGMDVLEYRAATYGEYGGFLNRLDVPTDRFFMSWDLRKDFRRPSAGKERVEGKGFPVLQVREARVSGKSGPVDLEIVEGVCLNPAGETFLVRIPRDFYVMLRETDIDNPEIRNIPLEWRMKTREAFQHFFAAGYKIADFLSIKDRTRRNFYVLRMDPSPDG